ncbi:MAG: hypothetical protein ACLUD2_08400 [Clostridium sp.]
MGRRDETAAEALEAKPSVNGFSEAEEVEEVVVDGEGAYAIPGLIDLHFHGCVGADVCDGTPEALKKIAQYGGICRSYSHCSGYHDAAGGGAGADIAECGGL